MRILITIVFALLVATTGFGQIKFFKLFTNNGSDLGQGVVQLEDSSYVITGSSSSFMDAPSQAFLLKLDSMGNYIWSNHYGGSEMESGRRVLYKKNFGFFICGYTNSIGNGGFDFYMAKVDENANLEWEKSFGGYGWEKVHDAVMTRDTGAVMVGETSSNLTDNKDMFIVRTDKNGDTLWTKTMGGTGDDFISSIRRHNDSLFVLGGQVWNEDSLMTKGYMAYMKEDGTFLWERTFGTNGNYWIHDVEIDGSRCVGVGGTTAASKDGIDFFFNHFDFNGSPMGPFEIPNPGDDDQMLITTAGPTYNYFHIVANTDNAWTYEGGVDVLIHKYLPNMAWQSGFGVGNLNPDIPGQIIRTSDGSAICVGYTTGVVSGGNEVFVAKIGPGIDDYPNPQFDVVINNIVIVDELDQVADIRVYPNPASESISISSEDNGYTNVKLIDAMGNVVLSQKLNFDLSLDLSELKNGWYILELSGSEVALVRKKVIIRK